jgi:hypothetical protein
MCASRPTVVSFLCVFFATVALAADDARDAAVRIAKEALARDLAIDVRRIALARVEPAEWRDGSLGCPKPGMSYTQMLMAGHRVLLRIGSASYEMHVSGERAVRCDSSRPKSKEIDTEAAAASVRVARLARSDLAARLNAETQEVSIEGIRRVRWPDANLGCPGTAGGDPVAGFIIELRRGDDLHTYHADYERVIYCKSASGG